MPRQAVGVILAVLVLCLPTWAQGPAPVRRSCSRPELEALVVHWSLRYGLDPLLVACLIRQESGWNPQAQSPAAAAGIMQFIPGTARDWGLEVSDRVDERLLPEKAIPAGCALLRSLLEQYQGNVQLALAAYNAGPERVRKAGYRVPAIAETQGYVANITAMYGWARQGRFQAFVTPVTTLAQLTSGYRFPAPVPGAVPAPATAPSQDALELEQGLAKSSFLAYDQ